MGEVKTVLLYNKHGSSWRHVNTGSGSAMKSKGMAKTFEDKGPSVEGVANERNMFMSSIMSISYEDILSTLPKDPGQYPLTNVLGNSFSQLGSR